MGQKICESHPSVIDKDDEEQLKLRPLKMEPNIRSDRASKLIGAFSSTQDKTTSIIGMGILITPNLVLTSAPSKPVLHQTLQCLRFILNIDGIQNKQYEIQSFEILTFPNSVLDYAIVKLKEITSITEFLPIKADFAGLQLGESIKVFGLLQSEVLKDITSPLKNTKFDFHQWGTTKSAAEESWDIEQISNVILNQEWETGAPIISIGKNGSMEIVGITPRKQKEETTSNTNPKPKGLFFKRDEKKVIETKSKEQQILRLMKEGQTLTQEEKYEEAVKRFKKVTELNPMSANAYCKMGFCQARLENLEEAMYCYKEAINLDNNNVEAHNMLGVIARKEGKMETAVQWFQKAILTDPNCVKAHNNLGFTFYLMKKPNEAIPCYLKAIVLDPSNVKAHNNMGAAYRSLDKPEEAIQWFKKVIKIDPTYSKAHNNIGFMLKEMGRIEEAKEHYRKAIESDPQNEVVYRNYLKVLNSPEEEEDGLKFLSKVMVDNPNCISASQIHWKLQEKSRSRIHIN